MQDRFDFSNASERLLALGARFRAVADSAPIIIWVTDAAGHNTFVNREFLDFVGINREESATFDWTSAVHPEDREPYVAKFLAAVRDARPFNARMRAIMVSPSVISPPRSSVARNPRSSCHRLLAETHDACHLLGR